MPQYTYSDYKKLIAVTSPASVSLCLCLSVSVSGRLERTKTHTHAHTQQNPIKLGGLGADLKSEEFLAAKAKAERMKAMAERVSLNNRQKILQSSKKAEPLPMSPHKAAPESVIKR